MINKYKNKKVKIGDREFDSKMEGDFYLHLCKLHNHADIEIQPKFILQEKFTKYGKTYREINYIADYRVGNVVYDVKGFTTDTFILKKKLFDCRYLEIHLTLITKSPKYLQSTYGEWIELDDLKKEQKKRKLKFNN